MAAFMPNTTQSRNSQVPSSRAASNRGAMPGSDDKLGDQQKLALIAFFQCKWPGEIYARWHNRHMQ